MHQCLLFCNKKELTEEAKKKWTGHGDVMYRKQELWTTQFPVPPPSPQARSQGVELRTTVRNKSRGGSRWRMWVCSASRKSFGPAFFKVSIDPLFDNLESGKRNFCFGKKVWKKSRILDSKICTNPVTECRHFSFAN